MVPLGGPRAMTVRRTLPQRSRSLIGAWCFIDHYGPDDVAATGGMVVPPHPHTGLQTVSWLFAGEIEHRDSSGGHAMVRPGELNLMTAGGGIQHSEVSTPTTTLLHGVQLWTALPDAARHGAPFFERFVPPVFEFEGASVSVFLGSLLGHDSTATAFTPIVGAQLDLPARTAIEVPVEQVSSTGCSSTPARWRWTACSSRAHIWATARRVRRRCRSVPANIRRASCCSAAPPSASRS